MAAQQRPLSPHLSIYSQGWTGTLSILHRATGVFIAMGAFVLLAWLLAVSGGDAQYGQFMACAGSIPGRLLLLVIFGCYFYHLLNGIRHLLWDIGWGLELPRARATGWTVVALSLAGTALVAWRAFGGAP